MSLRFVGCIYSGRETIVGRQNGNEYARCQIKKKKREKLLQGSGLTVKVGLAVYWVMKLFFSPIFFFFFPSMAFHGEATDGDYAGGRTGLLSCSQKQQQEKQLTAPPGSTNCIDR